MAESTDGYTEYDPSISYKLEADPDFDAGGRRLVGPHGDCQLTPAPLEDAHLVTSRPDCGEECFVALPVIDLDIPCRLIPSSTEGHFHLYIDKAVLIDDYWHLIDAMVEAGLVEPGYANASKARGYTAARLPWVKKATTTGEAA